MDVGPACLSHTPTLIIHDFWTYAGANREMQVIHFMKNRAVMRSWGGCSLSWPMVLDQYSIDGLREDGLPIPEPEAACDYVDT